VFTDHDPHRAGAPISRYCSTLPEFVINFKE
jgi:hypothetical protein